MDFTIMLGTTACWILLVIDLHLLLNTEWSGKKET